MDRRTDERSAMTKERQPDLFEPKPEPDDSHGEIPADAELWTDGTFRSPGSQVGLDFSIPFAESRSMLMQHRECDARSERAVETFEETFTAGEADEDSSAD
jgi:hypothetical protein